jgi:hypothetical protein
MVLVVATVVLMVQFLANLNQTNKKLDSFGNTYFSTNFNPRFVKCLIHR